MPTFLRSFAFMLVITGCAFSGTEGGDIPPTTIPPGPAPMPQPCRAGEQGVVLCVDFEDKPLVNQAIDHSQNQTHVSVDKVTTIPDRVPGEQAVLLSAESTLSVPPSSALDAREFTIEMWIRPDQKPPRKKGEGVAGLFENFAHYQMRLEEDLQIQCGLSTEDSRITSVGAVPLQEWSHVVCRYAAGELRVYLNGRLSRCEEADALPISLPDTIGSVIGARFSKLGTLTTDRLIGGVDNVRVYNIGIPEERICATSGKPLEECTRCPDVDGGDGEDGTDGD